MTSANPQHTALADAIVSLEAFGGQDLTQTLARIEASLQGVRQDQYADVLLKSGAKAEVLSGAALLKRLAGQINVVVHALGILLCLPRILEPSEAIQYVSLGAGNTGRDFDLETNRRIAEFKFIHWQGGPEAIRQNALFKDFYEMAEHATDKQRFLYVLGTQYVEKFFNGGRALSSVLSRNVKLGKEFTAKYGDSYRTVRDYYRPRKGLVTIQDVSPFVPELVTAAAEAEEAVSV
ncbi:MAG TPA: hypothetical protein VHB45_15600 [Alloacidobacterium sp.]|nr:hypothetical protein [Alloacidobacterium sp.]